MRLTIITFSIALGISIGFLIGLGYSLDRNLKNIKQGVIIVNDAQKELTDFANKRREFYKKTHDGGVK